MAEENEAEWIDIGGLTGDGGILKKILVEGKGPFATVGEKVKVHYVGTLKDTGEKFDSSRDRDDYFQFDLGEGRVIKGWDKGVATMKVGEKCILRCREDYAYGKAGSPPSIPPGATLDFEVELFANWDDVEGLSGVQALTLAAAEDEYTRIQEEASVTFNFSICDSAGDCTMDGTVGKENVSLIMDDQDSFADWPEWFHKCVRTLRKKHTKVFSVNDTSKYNVPESWGVSENLIHFRVDILDFQNPKESYERSTEENIEEAQKRKDKGNVHFKAGKFVQANTQYKKGCDALEHEIEQKDKPADLKDAFNEAMHNLYVSINANMAMVYLKQKKFDEGIESAEKVLQYEPKHLKALCRRAQCLAQTNQFAAAKADCDVVLKEDPNNSTAKQVLKYSKGKVAHEKKRMKKMAQNMFKSRKSSAKTEAGEEKKEQASKVEEPKKEAEEPKKEDMIAENDEEEVLANEGENAI